MKVLWFANAGNASEYLKIQNNKGGWVASLQNELLDNDNIQLGICFYYKSKMEDFFYEKTHNFPIKTNAGVLKKIYYRISAKNYSIDDVDLYMDVVEKFKPDIIHIFGTEIPFGLLINKINIPVLISIQGNITVYNYKMFAGFSEKFISRHTSFFDKIAFKDITHGYKISKKYAETEQSFLKPCKFVTGRTDWDKRISKILAPNAKYFHLDELIRKEFFDADWDGNINDEIKLVTTMSSPIYKGFETMVETIILLNKTFPQIKVKWTVIGIDKNSLVVRLTKKKYKNINEWFNQFVFYNNVNASQIVNLLLNCNIYVQSSHIENSPNSLCEAMLLGMPIIATFAGGTSSLLTDKKEGVLIQDGDPYSMAGAIIEYYENYDKAKLYGKNARERAIMRHDYDKVANDIISIYNEIINNN
jgi:glycosyltransferase involved in cell wall biosynthesis